jgi:hypothetical protein
VVSLPGGSALVVLAGLDECIEAGGVSGEE